MESVAEKPRRKRAEFDPNRNALTRLRVASGKTVEELCVAAGVTRNYWAQLEREEYQPRASTLARIARALAEALGRDTAGVLAELAGVADEPRA